MTDAELEVALVPTQFGASERERAEALARALAETGHRRHFDHLGIRHVVGKDGTLRRTPPWDAG